MRHLLLILLLSTPALADSRSGPVDTQKSLDGKTTYCQSQRDAGNVGYQPNLPIVHGGETLELTFGVVGVECNFSESKGFQWEVRSLTGPIPGLDLNGDPIVTHVKEAEAVVIDKNYRLIGAAALGDSRMQLVRLPLPIDKILNKSQRRSLDSGAEVTVRLEYFNRYKIEIERAGQIIFKGAQTGGSYFYTFTINKNTNGALVSTAVLIN